VGIVAGASALRGDVAAALKTQKLSRLIKKLNGHNGTSVEWNIKKVKTVQT
jgi:hypothetical protein